MQYALVFYILALAFSFLAISLQILFFKYAEYETFESTVIDKKTHSKFKKTGNSFDYYDEIIINEYVVSYKINGKEYTKRKQGNLEIGDKVVFVVYKKIPHKFFVKSEIDIYTSKRNYIDFFLILTIFFAMPLIFSIYYLFFKK